MKFFLERENGWVERRWQLFFGVWLSVGQSVGLVFLCVVPLLSGELDVHSFVYSNTLLSPLSRGDSGLCVQIFGKPSTTRLRFALNNK